MGIGRLVLLAAAAVALAGCETPSQKYGLAPPDPAIGYPQLNRIPSVELRTENMRPLEVAAAEERLDRDARRAASIRAAQVAPMRP
jgi:uncharacterized lipoprotein YajG